MFGADANWGRVLCAIGYADAEFPIEKVDVDLASENGSIAVCRDGAGVEFSEEFAGDIEHEISNLEIEGLFRKVEFDDADCIVLSKMYFADTKPRAVIL